MSDGKKQDRAEASWDSSNPGGFYRVLFEEASDGMFITDPHGRCVAVNPSGASLTGYLRDEIPGMAIADLIPLEDPAHDPFQIDELRQGRAIMKERRLCRKDGSWLPVEITARMLPDGNILNVVRDITERKNTEAVSEERARELAERKAAEEALRQSEERFRLTFDTSPDSININRLEDGMYVNINDGFTSLTGFTREDVIGKTSLEVNIWHDPKDRQELVRGLREKGFYNDLEAKFRRKDGSVVDGQMSARIILLQGVPHIISVTRDVTEHKRADEALKTSEANYREVFNASNDAIFVHDASTGAIVDVNRATLEMYGCSSEELLGLSVDNFSLGEPPYSQAEAREWVRKAVLDGPQLFEWRAKKRNGELFWAEVNLKAAAIGGSDRVLAVVRDISGRKRAEEEREKLRAQLVQAQKMELVGRLAGGVAHDFNNMLGVILGHAELALMHVNPSEPLQATLKEIQKAAQRSASLTRQLLGFARKQTVAPKVLDLNDTVANMLNMLRRLIGEDIDLAWRPGASLWPTKIDPVQIDQILANLCVNARDAIAGPGKVTIETTNVAFDQAYCSNHPGLVPGEYVMLAVSDDGCGMDKDVQKHIFEPFFTTKGLGQGTGLGLATVYGIVKQNEGFISVYSESGKGTTFKMYLPRFAGGSIVTKAATPEGTLHGRGETVLLVEDEAAILDIGRAMLEQMGYRVLIAGTPSEALRQAEAHTGEIHLLVTDLVMPEMNGRDLAERIRAVIPGLKCLFMSGYTANVIAHHGILDEGVCFVQKPFSLNDLASKVREVLKQKPVIG